MAGYRVGVDVGGTFTDLICVTPDGDVVLDKTPTTTDDQSSGVMTGLAQLADRFGVPLAEFCGSLDIVVHGTTTADNTMIEMNGAATGLLVTEGHRDEIEMRRVHKEEIWDPSYPAPPPIARRRARIPIPERMSFKGEVVRPLDEDAVRAGVRRLAALGVESIAVMFLFSFVNPDHERRAAEIIREELPDLEHVSLSHEVMARGPEFERVSTTLVNAYVAPRIAVYVGQLQEKLRGAGYAGPLLIMQATGGVMPPEYVSRRAVSLLASGPTGGVMGATLAASKVGVHDFVAVDMGGTSFDVCLVRGSRPEIKTDWNWRYRYYIGLPMVDVQSVGAGGGSIARVRQGALLVGPESAGSTPGPVCYGRGGALPTVTDADVVLGYVPAEAFAGGRMRLDVDAARAAIEREVATPLGLDVVEAAWGIERIVNANMANATRRVLASHGADPRTLSMIAYGGNGAVHAWAIATELGIDRVLVPKAAPAFSALGVLVADYVVDLVRAYIVPLSQVDIDQVRVLMRELLDEATKELEPTGLPEPDIDVGLFAQMCYPGQNFDMSVPVPEGTGLDDPGLLDLAERFHEQHQAERGFAFRNQQPLVRGVRLVARGFTPKPERPELGALELADSARTGTRPAFFGDGFVDTAVFDGAQLGPGAEVRGPALVDEPFTVVVVPPGARAAVDDSGNYDLDSPDQVPAWLTEDEHAKVAAAADRLIPPLEDHPGGKVVGVADYVDMLLGAFTLDPPRIWAGGPFSGRHGGDPGFAQFLPLSHLEERAWRTRIEGSQGIPEREVNGPVVGWQAQYRDALAALGDDFADAPPEEQDARLDAHPDFKALLYTHACEGAYAAPEYGGNRDLAGWRAIGYEGDVQPRGYTDQEVSGRE